MPPAHPFPFPQRPHPRRFSLLSAAPAQHVLYAGSRHYPGKGHHRQHHVQRRPQAGAPVSKSGYPAPSRIQRRPGAVHRAHAQGNRGGRRAGLEQRYPPGGTKPTHHRTGHRDAGPAPADRRTHPKTGPGHADSHKASVHAPGHRLYHGGLR